MQSDDRLRRILDEWTPGIRLTESQLEAKFLEMCAKAELPLPTPQARVRTPNPSVLPAAIGAEAARSVLAALRALVGHRSLSDDVSLAAADVPALTGYRQVTDAHLIVLARRHGTRLVTFDAGTAALAGGRGIELLTR